jgi:hypothetical protein
MLGVIVSGTLDLAGFHASVIVAAAFMALGALASLLGIRNAPR